MTFASLFGAKESNNGYTNYDNEDTLPTVQAVAVQQYPPPAVPMTTTKKSPIQINSNHDFFLMLGRQPCIMHLCPQCNVTNVRTRVTTYPSFVSWLLVIGLFVCVFPMHYFPMYMLPLAFLPLVFDKLKRSDHFCSKCNKKVGSVKPLSDCGVKHIT